MAVAGRRLDERRVPLMGVMGAFVFAAQMVNFPILAGTSGHLGGGFLLGILLGAPLGVIVMGSILVVQALLFQDGGVEALGANIFVMGVLPCLLGGAVRWLWTRERPGLLTHAVTFLGGVLAVLAGATAVTLFLWWSRSLPANVTLAQALGVMDFIHLWIGLVEGFVTVAVVRFILAVRRDAVLGPAPGVKGTLA
ncbi:MAG: energy-coupling factor ABC transporter permease [Planctomycetota bacterium]|nr:energy-coupling factor ABC transporter permease [Planctomycetota bacterium]